MFYLYSNDGARRVTPGGTPNSTLQLVPPQSGTWRRSRSLSDTEKTLDDALRELDSLKVNIDDDLEVARRHRHYSSNDSAMGESELITSPAPSAGSEPSTLTRARHIDRNRSDSAFSNNTSPTNSSNEGMNNTSEMEFVHQRNASTLSTTSEPERPHPHSSSTLRTDLDRPTPDSVSLPTFSPERELGRDLSTQSQDTSVPNLATHSLVDRKESGSDKDRSKQKKKWKLHTMPSVTSTGTYSPSRSPVLKPKGVYNLSSEALEDGSPNSSANHTPTPPTVSNAVDSIERPTSNSLSDEGTVI